jgi:hypothetical protein
MGDRRAGIKNPLRAATVETRTAKRRAGTGIQALPAGE